MLFEGRKKGGTHKLSASRETTVNLTHPSLLFSLPDATRLESRQPETKGRERSVDPSHKQAFQIEKTLPTSSGSNGIAHLDINTRQRRQEGSVSPSVSQSPAFPRFSAPPNAHSVRPPHHSHRTTAFTELRKSVRRENGIEHFAGGESLEKLFNQ